MPAPPAGSQPIRKSLCSSQCIRWFLHPTPDDGGIGQFAWLPPPHTHTECPNTSKGAR